MTGDPALRSSSPRIVRSPIVGTGQLLAGLALKDVLHERLLSLCLVVALAGLVAPLLVLFGLKHGVIQKLQDELIQDPVNRELKPAETKQYPPDFFTRLRGMPEVAFVVESVTEGASVIRVQTNSGDSQLADMLPTAEADPLLLENNTPVPADGQVVLSAKLAESLDIAADDTVILSAQRTENGDIVRAEEGVEVKAVLPLRADVLERAYVPWKFARDIESFREGFAVPQREWPGLDRNVVPGYQSIIFSLDRTLSASEENSLLVNSDFFHLNLLSASDFSRKLGIAAPPGKQWYEVSVIDKLAGKISVERVSQRLRNLGASLWLWNSPVAAQLQLRESTTVDSTGDGWHAVELATNGGPVSTSSTKADLPISVALVSGTAAGNLGLNVSPDNTSTAELKVDLQGNEVSFPVQLVQESTHAGDEATAVLRVDPGLLGQLAQGRLNPVSFNSQSGTFEREALGARGFRLFADSIYNVAKVRSTLLAMEVPTLSALQAIIRLQALDKGLTSLFLLIAVAGVVTSVIVLVANQIGSVQRKRDSLAQVRLLGLSKSEVSLLPLFTGTYLSIAGGALGVAIALFTAWVINRFFASSLGFDDAVCVIKGSHALLCLSIVLALTALSSLFAVIWTTRVDPAEGMRYE